ncbi:MAG: hypothetical protein P8L20_08600 [Flavobacteriales bacterium]|nr:hypothetical protein [Flavobacteriales bacterium]
MSIVMILLGLTNTNYSQSKIIPKSVEARMSQNRQSQKSTFEDISVIYSFNNQRLESRDQAQQFDKYVMTNFGAKIKSCATSDGSSGFYTVAIAKGYVTPDDLKFITTRAGGDFVAWKSVYALNENVNISETNIDTRHEISKSEYDQMPKEKKTHIDANPGKYKIVIK